MTCTFFGYEPTPKFIKPILNIYITDIIFNFRAFKFYVGNNGHFDEMAMQALKEIKPRYPIIEYRVVPAYPPKDGIKIDHPTEFPEGIEKIPKELAIDFRNNWMLDKSDIVITYITHGYGDTTKYIGQAKLKKKIIINLSGVDIAPF